MTDAAMTVITWIGTLFIAGLAFAGICLAVGGAVMLGAWLFRR